MVFLGLLLSLALEYIRPGIFWPWVASAKLGTIVPITVFVISLFAPSQTSMGDVLSSFNGRLFAFFGACVLISLFAAEVWDAAYQRFVAVVGYSFVLFVIARSVENRRQIGLVFAVLITSHILLLFLNPDLVLNPGVRSYLKHNILGDGNDFGFSLCVIFPMVIYLVLESRSKIGKGVWLTALVGTLLAIIGTQSRGASLGLVATVLYLWLQSRSKVMGIALMLGMVLVAALYASPVYFTRMGTLVDYQQETSASRRIIAWKGAIRMAGDHPVLGVGSGHFPRAFGLHYRPHEGFHWMTAHSVYFLALGELGIPGFVFITMFVIGNYRRMARRVKEIRASSGGENAAYERTFVYLNASLVGFGVAGAFLSVLYYPHMFVLGGLFLAVDEMYKRAIKGRED